MIKRGLLLLDAVERWYQSGCQKPLGRLYKMKSVIQMQCSKLGNKAFKMDKIVNKNKIYQIHVFLQNFHYNILELKVKQFKMKLKINNKQ